MKNIKTLAICIIITAFSGYTFLFSQEEQKEYEFTDIKKLPVTSVKNQYRTGTCWSFSTLAILESEILKKGYDEINLSPMYIVRTGYLEKAVKYVRMHGTIKFSGGGALNDPIDLIKKYGIVPEEIYTGLKVDEKRHIHYEMDEVFKAYVDKIIENQNGVLTPVWFSGFEKLVDNYLGEAPKSFNYKGKNYTPETFLNNFKINLDDYVLITSFNHHPFYSKFILEVPDNWSWGYAYNLPINELKQILYYSINNDYTIAWASDISDDGFNYRKGIAIVPGKNWNDMDDDEIDSVLKYPHSQRQITQEMRQKAFDNYETQDDHGMQIFGLAKDQLGNDYFIVKNSWGIENSKYNGFFYASESYVLYKTLTILVNKNGIPDQLRKKMGL